MNDSSTIAAEDAWTDDSQGHSSDESLVILAEGTDGQHGVGLRPSQSPRTEPESQEGADQLLAAPGPSDSSIVQLDSSPVASQEAPTAELLVPVRAVPAEPAQGAFDAPPSAAPVTPSLPPASQPREARASRSSRATRTSRPRRPTNGDESARNTLDQARDLFLQELRELKQQSLDAAFIFPATPEVILEGYDNIRHWWNYVRGVLIRRKQVGYVLYAESELGLEEEGADLDPDLPLPEEVARSLPAAARPVCAPEEMDTRSMKVAAFLLRTVAPEHQIGLLHYDNANELLVAILRRFYKPSKLVEVSSNGLENTDTRSADEGEGQDEDEEGLWSDADEVDAVAEDAYDTMQGYTVEYDSADSPVQDMSLRELTRQLVATLRVRSLCDSDTKYPNPAPVVLNQPSDFDAWWAYVQGFVVERNDAAYLVFKDCRVRNGPRVRGPPPGSDELLPEELLERLPGVEDRPIADPDAWTSHSRKIARFLLRTVSEDYRNKVGRSRKSANEVIGTIITEAYLPPNRVGHAFDLLSEFQKYKFRKGHNVMDFVRRACIVYDRMFGELECDIDEDIFTAMLRLQVDSSAASFHRAFEREIETVTLDRALELLKQDKELFTAEQERLERARAHRQRHRQRRRARRASSASRSAGSS